MKGIELESQLSKVLDIAEKANRLGVAHLSEEGQSYNGRQVLINGKEYLNFSSCCYLGLSLDDRVINGAIDGVKRYGTSFPTSRSFLSMGYLEELEDKLEQIFGYSCILTSSTSLAHTAFLPLFISKEDVFICDHQVHASVQAASGLIHSKGCLKDVVRHNDIAKLEEKIIAYSSTKRNVWYFADGIYSMYGDTAPLNELRRLLDKYDNFHVYMDDAHGMSWMGENGKGFVLSQIDLHPRMVLSTSLGKAYGSIGGVLICNDKELKKKIKSCGNAFIFSSPLPPSVIGASLAAAEIHLSEEMVQLQNKLKERIEYFKNLALQLDLPLLGKGDTPIFFIPSGNPDICFKISQRMMEKGFYQSSAVYPSVSYNSGGVRFTVTNWLELEDIDKMLRTLAIERSKVLVEEGINEQSIRKNFKGVEYNLAAMNMAGSVLN